MASKQTTVELGAAAMKSLAHPLRLRLLSALRLRGPATATDLARQLDTNSGQTSYHLRQLAEVGLVEDDHEHSTARDRYWRASHRGSSWTSSEFRDDREGWAADTAVVGQVTRLHARWMDDQVENREHLSPAWLNASTVMDAELHLTPEQAKEMAEELAGVVQRYRDAGRVDAPTAERVTTILHVFPHPDPSV